MHEHHSLSLYLRILPEVGQRKTEPIHDREFRLVPTGVFGEVHRVFGVPKRLLERR